MFMKTVMFCVFGIHSQIDTYTIAHVPINASNRDLTSVLASFYSVPCLLRNASELEDGGSTDTLQRSNLKLTGEASQGSHVEQSGVFGACSTRSVHAKAMYRLVYFEVSQQMDVSLKACHG